MSTTPMNSVNEAGRAAELPEAVRGAVRDLVLVLADCKRLLGMRYGQWLLGAPELEAGIACASMAQDEWGHARLLYALLRDFGEDVERLEHGREPSEYASSAVLDEEPRSWPELVALNALFDTALTVQLEALTDAAYVPLRQRVQKLIEEETFHAAHGEAWFRRLAGAGREGHDAMQRATTAILPEVLRWFGADSHRARSLRDASIAAASGSDLRTRYLQRVGGLLRLVGDDTALLDLTPSFEAFDEATRRPPGALPDEGTIAQVRGDRNRAFLMD
jgi:ring-1,2-phenylacetyl-CoA epoxidase subunit PaaC